MIPTQILRSTIFALSTVPGRSAIGVIRVLGSLSKYVFHQLTQTKRPPKHRLTSLRKLHGENGLLDEALTVYFKAPYSYTGEDSLELHVHGGTAIVRAVMNAIKSLHDPTRGHEIRLAEQGEFSKRAFLNGRLDLTEIEGIRDLIDAETELQRLSALASVSGHNKITFSKWREEIVKNIAFLTTLVDFGEEHDVEEVDQLLNQVETSVDTLIKDILLFLTKVESSRVLFQGIKLSLFGPPNAGKLSILNFLANEEAAIVSDIAGTTRDVIDVPLDIEGFKVVVGDTAGIRAIEEADTIEKEGIRRAKKKSFASDLALVIVQAVKELDAEVMAHIKTLKENGKNIIAVINKSDLLATEAMPKALKDSLEELGVDNVHLVSCLNGHGMDGLKLNLKGIFEDLSASGSSDPVAVSERAQDILKNDILHGLQEFKIYKDHEDIALASESLKRAVEGIGKVTGEAVGVEEILGVVFSSFCIGK